jgi:hypothetical protein
VLQVLSRQAVALRHLEVCEVKAWCYGATNQRVLIRLFQTGAEPVPGRRHPLELFARFRVLAQFDHAVISSEVDAVKEQGGPGIKVPDLIGSQAMQSGEVFSCEQEVDRRGGTARPSEGGRQSGLLDDQRSPVSLAEKAAFGMRLEVQLVDPILRAGHASAYSARGYLT